MEGPWKKLADGCHCNRRTVPMLEANGFKVEIAAEMDKLPMFPLTRPIVSGVATAGPDPAARPA